MPDFQLNLMKDRVMTPARRRSTFWALSSYLFVCGLILIAASYRAASDFARARWQRDDIARLESEFKQAHPEQASVSAYAQELRLEAVALADALEGVQDSMGERIALGPLLRRLADPLPEDAFLVNLDYDCGKRMLKFDLASPVLTAEGKLPNAAELVSTWKQDEHLMDQAEHIASVASKRMLIDGRAMFIMRFSVSLAKAS
jgi:hypothetical protein